MRCGRYVPLNSERGHNHRPPDHLACLPLGKQEQTARHLNTERGSFCRLPRSVLPQGKMRRGRYVPLNAERGIYHRPPRPIQDKTKKRAQLVKAVRVFILSQLI